MCGSSFRIIKALRIQVYFDANMRLADNLVNNITQEMIVDHIVSQLSYSIPPHYSIWRQTT